MKACPFCSEQVQDDAIKCKHCLSDLSTKEAREKMRLQEQAAKAETLKNEISLRTKDLPMKITDYLNKHPQTFKKLKEKPDSDIVEIIGEKIRRKQIAILYIASTFAMLVWAGSDNFALKIFSVSLIIAIWLHPEKGQDMVTSFRPRIENFKRYPMRITFSAIIWLFLMLGAYGSYAQKQEMAMRQEQERQQAEEQSKRIEEDKKLYSVPSIEIKSPQGLQPSSTYILRFTQTWGENVTVNGETLAGSGWTYEKTVQLASPSMALAIAAKNKYYSKAETINISRAKTTAEIKADQMAEAKRKEDEKLAVAEKQWQERLARIAAKKADIAKMFSAWDGSYAPLESAVKKSMNDPDSFEHDGTTWSLIEDPKKGDLVRIRMNYRGKNGFGGMVRGTVLAELNLKENSIAILEQ